MALNYGQLGKPPRCYLCDTVIETTAHRIKGHTRGQILICFVCRPAVTKPLDLPYPKREFDLGVDDRASDHIDAMKYAMSTLRADAPAWRSIMNLDGI